MIHFTGSSDPQDPTGKAGPGGYIKCDCCNRKIYPGSVAGMIEHDKNTGMNVCAECKPQWVVEEGDPEPIWEEINELDYD